MACITDPESLSPDERKVLEAIQTDSLSIDEIRETTKLPLFKVRSIIRKLSELEFVEESNDKYKMASA